VPHEQLGFAAILPESSCQLAATHRLAHVRLGIIADIHGNEVALRAILQDADRLEVDRWWALGDLVLFGPRPAEALELLQDLPGLGMLRGNTDRLVDSIRALNSPTFTLRTWGIGSPRPARRHRAPLVRVIDARHAVVCRWIFTCSCGSGSAEMCLSGLTPGPVIGNAGRDGK